MQFISISLNCYADFLIASSNAFRQNTKIKFQKNYLKYTKSNWQILSNIEKFFKNNFDKNKKLFQWFYTSKTN